jgi:hypothetical protein
MHFASRRSSLASYGATFLAGALFAWIAAPLWRAAVMSWNQQDYGLLVEQCDGAMRDHFQAKQSFDREPTVETANLLKSGEVGLIVCQDYDLYQKRLLQWGLREEELSQMRLRAIEARSTDLQEVIETHEIRF